MTAIFCEPELLKDCEIAKTIEETTFPFFEINEFEDVKRAESREPRLRDMHLLFVIEDFEGDLFKVLRKGLKRRDPKATIIGPAYLLELVADKENGGKQFVFAPGKLIYKNVFDSRSVVVGGQPKDQYDAAILRAKMMGAMARDEINIKVDLLLTTNLRSKKFSQATKYDIPVIKRQLVFDLWARRTEKDLRLTDQMIQQYRYLPFEQLQIKFVGFQGDQLFQLEEELLANGGEVWNDENDRKSTNYLYIVRNDYPKDDSFLYDDLDKIVMEEWFWSCIQIGCKIDHAAYRPKWVDRMTETYYENTEISMTDISSAQFNSPQRPANTTMDKHAIRHTLLLDFAMRVGITNAEIEGCTMGSKGTPQKKERKSLVAAVKEGLGKGPESGKSEREGGKAEDEKEEKVNKNRQARKMVAQELFDTEKNYVKLLGYVIEEYRDKLDHSGLISHTECGQIFGNLPDLRNLHVELEMNLSQTMQIWSDDTRIGELMASYCTKFLNLYPPYINYLDRSLQLIKDIQENNNKFKAFLRSILARATYSRQDLPDLLSLPVQRLPRYALLLRELQKKTEGMDATHGDIEHLDRAIQQIKKVTCQINSAKGQTDSHYNMFEIFNEIQDCPHSIVSAQRQFRFRFNCTVADNSKELNTKMGEKLAIFFFNDMFVLCRRKRTLKRGGPSKVSRTPKRTNSGRGAEKDTVFFKSQYSNSFIVKMIDVNETSDCQRCISFMIQTKEYGIALLTFQVKTDALKEEVISTVSDLVTKLKLEDRNFAEEFVSKVDHNQLNVTTKDLSSRNIKRIVGNTKRQLTKFSSKFNLHGDLSRVDTSPILTQDQRYDSEASLTSIDSVMSMAAQSTMSSYITPQKAKVPNSPSIGFKSVRGLFSGKKKAQRQNTLAEFPSMENPTSLPPTFKK